MRDRACVSCMCVSSLCYPRGQEIDERGRVFRDLLRREFRFACVLAEEK